MSGGQFSLNKYIVRHRVNILLITDTNCIKEDTHVRTTRLTKPAGDVIFATDEM